MAQRPGPGDALLIVDPQVDFCPEGALPVSEGDRIFGVVNKAAAHFDHVVASRDWHPAHHVSFQERGGPWPVHCQEGTAGAEFHQKLDRAPIEHVFSKGTDADREAYSAFDGTDLAEWLREHRVNRLFVTGLATDYCVRASVLDARAAGFDVVVLTDGIRAVEVQAGDGARALAEMQDAGAKISESSELDGG